MARDTQLNRRPFIVLVTCLKILNKNIPLGQSLKQLRTKVLQDTIHSAACIYQHVFLTPSVAFQNSAAAKLLHIVNSTTLQFSLSCFHV